MRPNIRRSARLALLVLCAGPLAACGGIDETYPRQPHDQDWEQPPMRDPSSFGRPGRDPSDRGGLTDEQMRNARPMPLGEDSGRRCEEGFGNDPNCGSPVRRGGGGRASSSGSGESPAR